LAGIDIDIVSQVKKKVSQNFKSFKSLADYIHKNPEIAFRENLASAKCKDILSRQGFTLTKSKSGLKTAFIATYGRRRPTIGLLAEYDALPEIGHACGHNLIAAISIGAAICLKDFCDDLGFTVKVIGTPAEEGGGGKILMLNAGDFETCDYCALIHPAPVDAVHMKTKALKQFEISYHGKAAHAASSSYLGINALDAIEVANVSISMLRQQLKPADQIQGVITNGGDVPNVIPELATGHYIIRSDTEKNLKVLEKRFLNCVKAGAVATGAKVSIHEIGLTYSDFNENKMLQNTYSKAMQLANKKRKLESNPDKWMVASTDMGNVSKLIPCLHATIGIDCKGSANHQREFAQHCTGSSADSALKDAITALCLFTILLSTPKKNNLLS
jgi:amidohydrolase